MQVSSQGRAAYDLQRSPQRAHLCHHLSWSVPHISFPLPIHGPPLTEHVDRCHVSPLEKRGKPLSSALQITGETQDLRGGFHLQREHFQFPWSARTRGEGNSHWDQGRDQRAGVCPKGAVGQPCRGWFNTCAFPELAIKGCTAWSWECLIFFCCQTCKFK